MADPSPLPPEPEDALAAVTRERDALKQELAEIRQVLNQARLPGTPQTPNLIRLRTLIRERDTLQARVNRIPAYLRHVIR